jgi:hypothetical protein
MRKVLVIGYVWPEPASSAAGTRMMQLLDYFLLQEYSVTFATTATPTPYSEDLTTKGITVEKIILNSNTFNDFIEKLSPEIVVYDRYMMEEQFGWRVAQSCPCRLKHSGYRRSSFPAAVSSEEDERILISRKVPLRILNWLCARSPVSTVVI